MKSTTNGKEVEEPTHLEATSMAAHIPEVPNAPVATQGKNMANLTQGLGNMSVDPVWVHSKFVDAELKWLMPIIYHFQMMKQTQSPLFFLLI
jgi:hypothetical protein